MPLSYYYAHDYHNIDVQVLQRLGINAGLADLTELVAIAQFALEAPKRLPWTNERRLTLKAGKQNQVEKNIALGEFGRIVIS